MQNKPIVIIKTGKTIQSLPPSAGDFEDWIAHGLGLPEEGIETISVFEGEPLPDPSAVAGAVITGSAAMVTDREDWSESTAKYVRELVARDVPLLGICYGHQLIAHALGGEVGWNPRGREIGTWEITLRQEARTDPLFQNLPVTFPAHTTHSQSVLRPPPQAKLLGSSDRDPYQILRFGRCAWGVQFHPEFDASIMRAYVQERYSDLESEGLKPDKLLERIGDTDQAASVLSDFADLVERVSK